MTGNKSVFFNQMDDFGMGVSLYESEMETDMNEEELHMQRCIIKGKRAKRKQCNDLMWWRHREFPSDMLKRMEMKVSNKRARGDLVKLKAKARCVSLAEEELDDIDILPAKYAGLARCSWAFV